MADFFKEIEGELRPIYALIGGESVLIHEAVAALRAKTLTQAPDFNRDEFRADEVDAKRVIEAAQTLPMMAARRFVHLAAIHKLKAEGQEALAAYVAAPAPTTVLVLTGEKLDGRRKLGQSLNKKKVVFSFDAPKQHDLPSWLMRRSKQRGIALEPDAAQLLADMVGPQLGILDRSLDQLDIYAGADAPIVLEDVEALIAATRVHSIFELTDAIGARDLPAASMLLRKAIDNGESGLMVLGMITRQLRQLLQLKELESRRLPQTDLARTLGVRPFLLPRLREQARRYSASEVARALNAAHRADIAMKSTRLSHGVVLDRLLLETLSERANS